MEMSVGSLPLIDLLPLAVEQRIIDDWDVDGHHFVFRREKDWLYVHAVVAGSFLRALLGCETAQSNRIIKRVALN